MNIEPLTFHSFIVQRGDKDPDGEAHLVNGELRGCVFILVHLLGPSRLLSSLPRGSSEHARLDWNAQK